MKRQSAPTVSPPIYFANYDFPFWKLDMGAPGLKERTTVFPLKLREKPSSFLPLQVILPNATVSLPSFFHQPRNHQSQQPSLFFNGTDNFLLNFNIVQDEPVIHFFHQIANFVKEQLNEHSDTWFATPLSTDDINWCLSDPIKMSSNKRTFQCKVFHKDPTFLSANSGTTQHHYHEQNNTPPFPVFLESTKQEVDPYLFRGLQKWYTCLENAPVRALVELCQVRSTDRHFYIDVVILQLVVLDQTEGFTWNREDNRLNIMVKPSPPMELFQTPPLTEKNRVEKDRTPPSSSKKGRKTAAEITPKTPKIAQFQSLEDFVGSTKTNSSTRPQKLRQPTTAPSTDHVVAAADDTKPNNNPHHLEDVNLDEELEALLNWSDV